MSVYHLEQMTWKEVDTLPRDATIFLLPVSPIEEHGPHLPLATDFYGARDMAEHALEVLETKDKSLNYVLVPGLPVGCSEIAMDFPGTLSVRGRTLMRLIYDVCSAIARHGFRYIVVSNHHLDWTHVKAIDVALKKVRDRYGINVYDPASNCIYSDWKSEEEEIVRKMGLDPHTEVHADVKETSFIKHAYPGLLRRGYVNLSPLPLSMEEFMKKRIRTLKKMGAVDGYIGSPASATEEQGKNHLHEGGELLAEWALRLYHGEELQKMDSHIRLIMKLFIRLR